MHDDLNRIESTYGSVADYNRVREEAENKEFWDNLDPETQDRLLSEQKAKQDQYNREVEALEIEPSSLAVNLTRQFVENKAKINMKRESSIMTYNEYVYESKHSYDKFLENAIPQIEESYGIKFEKGSQFGESDPGKFSVSFEKERFGTVIHYAASNLDKEQFMQVYTDLREIVGYKAFPTYRDDKEHMPDIFGKVSDKHFATGLTIGELRRNYFDRWGVPNDDTHEILRNLEQSVEQPTKADIAKSKLASAMKEYDNDEEQMSTEVNFV